MPRELLVFGEKTFKITVPDDCKITFGPFSPPTKREMDYGHSDRAKGTLRIYGKTKEHLIAVFAGVTGFRDLSIQYAEEVVREEGATIWKSDEHGYMREDKQSGKRHWIEPLQPAIESGGSEVEEVPEIPF